MELEFSWEENEYIKTVQKASFADDILLADVRIKFLTKCVPERTRLSLGINMTDIFSTWSPQTGYDRGLHSDMNKLRQTSRSASWAPIKTIINAEGQNRLTVAVRDFKTPMAVLSGISEEDAKLCIDIDFFTAPTEAREEYSTVIRIDMRKVPFYRSVSDVREWWMDGRKIYVPEAAKEPIYSTWYGFHQNLEPQKLLEECRIASELGMKTIIIDDGWHTANADRGYAFCGDWEPEDAKVGSMSELTKKIHDMGMKVMLWYSVPFVGRNSAVWDKFKGMYLDSEDKQWCRLDPRFPQVREYLIDLYKSAVMDWGIDGLKLDFIDSFELFDESIEPREGQDIVSLEDAIERLLGDALNELRSIDPDICIEFRQSYIGPLMQTYGNMLRVSDCPGDAMTNRLGSVDLRLTSGACPVHSDPLMWHKEDSAESAARQFLNVIFAVPQISVRLEDMSDEQRRMLRFYLDFWRRNRDILLDGELVPEGPEQNYSLVSSCRNGEGIAVIYGNAVYECSRRLRKLTLINSGSGKAVYVHFEHGCGTGKITVYGCTGNIISNGEAEGKGTLRTDVPLCGMAVIEFVRSAKSTCHDVDKSYQ